MNDLITVIIPVYNVENYVAETIKSVLIQSYSNIEILLINDGSTDKSLEIINQIAKEDDRIKVIDKINEGLSSARELGVRHAHGKYFVTIDSDDILDQDYIKEMHEAIVQYNADIALCARKTFDASGNQEVLLLSNVERYICIDKKMLDKGYNYIAGDYQMSDSWNKMYRTAYVLSTDVHFIMPKQYNGTDLLFNYCLLMHCPKIVTVNRPLYFYRLTEKSRVRRKNKHLEVGFKYILDRLLEEKNIIGGSEELEDQIYAAYFSMIKYATQDLTEEIQKMSYSQRISEYDKILITLPLTKRKTRILHATRKELKFFVILLLMRSAKGIDAYYTLRSYRRNK